MRSLKNLSMILLGGFLVFQALAIVQEWEVFGTAWFGGGDEVEEGLTEEERQAAADAVYLALSLLRHFHASSGDPRFAERMPVSDAILAELRTEVGYLARNGRVEDPVLNRLEVISVEEAGPRRAAPRRATVRTREFWTVHTRRVGVQHPLEAPRSGMTRREYLVALEGGEWRVMGWDLMSGTDPESADTEPAEATPATPETRP